MVLIFCISFQLLLLCGANNSSVEEFSKNYGLTETEGALQKLNNLEVEVKSFIKSTVRFVLPYFMRIAEEAKLSAPCTKSGIIFLRDLLRLKEWTLRLLDSSGKPSAGLFSGSIWIRGDYDQCLNIGTDENDISSNRKKEIVHGKYCILRNELPSYAKETIEAISSHNNSILIKLIKKIIKPLSIARFIRYAKSGKEFRYDVCVPSSCSENDLSSIVKQLFQGQLSIKVEFCKTKESTNYSVAELICIIIFSLMFFWVISATIIDILMRCSLINNNAISEKIIPNFISVSAFKSVRMLLNKNLQKQTLSLYGMKTFITYIIIFGHVFIFFNMSDISENNFNFFKVVDHLSIEIGFHTCTIIETYFFISGFLMLYLRKKEERNCMKQYITLLLKRIIRLTVPVMCTLACFIILPLIGDGPFWHFIVQERNYVERNWWKFIFHVENFTRSVSTFTIILWFMNALMQLTVFCLPFIIILDRRPTAGKICLIALILAGFISEVAIRCNKKYYIFFGYSMDTEKNLHYILNIYKKPYYSHLSTYCSGLLVGSILSNNKDLKFGKKIMMLFWITSGTLIGLVIFGLHNYLKEIFPNENIILIHNILSPYAWTIGVAWICIACTTGYGGVINNFLSLRIFVIYGRLNLWMYLLHILFMIYIFGQSRNGINISEMNVWMLFIFVIFLTTIGSFFFYIFVESPMNFIVKLLLDSKNSEIKPSSEKDCKLENVTIRKIS